MSQSPEPEGLSSSTSNPDLQTLRSSLEEQRRICLQTAASYEEEKAAHQVTQSQLAQALQETERLKSELEKTHVEPFHSVAKLLELQQRVAELEAEAKSSLESWQKERADWEVERQLLQNLGNNASAAAQKSSQRSSLIGGANLRHSPSSESIVTSSIGGGGSGSASAGTFPLALGLGLGGAVLPTPSSGTSSPLLAPKGHERIPSITSSPLSSPLPSPRGSISSFQNLPGIQGGEVRVPAEFITLLQSYFEELQLQVDEQESRFFDCERYVLKSHAAKYVRFAGVMLREKQLNTMIEELDVEEYELKNRALSVSDSEERIKAVQEQRLVLKKQLVKVLKQKTKLIKQKTQTEKNVKIIQKGIKKGTAEEFSQKDVGLIEFVGNGLKLGKMVIITADGCQRIALPELVATLKAQGIEPGLNKILAKSDMQVPTGEGAAFFEKKKKPVKNSAKDGEAEKLPPGWEKSRDETGAIFYVDHRNRMTHWSLPSDVVWEQSKAPKTKTKKDKEIEKEPKEVKEKEGKEPKEIKEPKEPKEPKDKDKPKEKLDKVEKAEKPERAEKLEKGEKADRPEKSEKSEKADKERSKDKGKEKEKEKEKERVKDKEKEGDKDKEKVKDQDKDKDKDKGVISANRARDLKKELVNLNKSKDELSSALASLVFERGATASTVEIIGSLIRTLEEISNVSVDAANLNAQAVSGEVLSLRAQLDRQSRLLNEYIEIGHQAQRRYAISLQQLKSYHDLQMQREAKRFDEYLKLLANDQLALGKLVSKINLLEFSLNLGKAEAPPAERTPYLLALEKNVESAKNSISFLGDALDRVTKENLEYERRIMELLSYSQSHEDGSPLERKGFQLEVERILDMESFLHLSEDLKSGRQIQTIHARAEVIAEQAQEISQEVSAMAHIEVDQELQRLKAEINQQAQGNQQDQSDSDLDSDDDDDDEAARMDVDLETVFGERPGRAGRSLEGPPRVGKILISADVPKKTTSWTNWFS